MVIMPCALMAQSDRISNFGLGATLRSNGLGLTFQKEVGLKKSQLSRYYYGDFVTHKHTKESKIVNHQVENKMPYVFGKLNHNALARIGVGFSKSLVDKSSFNNVGIKFQSVVGLSVAMQRPVYVRIEEKEGDVQIVDNVRYSPERVPDSKKIIGYSRNGDGWDEISYRPGVLARANIAISWQEFSRTSKQVNVGVTIDYFPGGLPIMAFADNPKVYPTFFLGFMWVFQTHE